MNHFQTHLGPHAKQKPAQPKPSSEATSPASLSQAELRDIVIALLG